MQQLVDECGAVCHKTGAAIQRADCCLFLSLTSPKMTMRKVEAHTPISPEVMSASKTDVAAFTICARKVHTLIHLGMDCK
jgi:hypothetical protein